MPTSLSSPSWGGGLSSSGGGLEAPCPPGALLSLSPQGSLASLGSLFPDPVSYSSVVSCPWAEPILQWF